VKRPLLQRFSKYVEREGDCWVWVGYTKDYGRGWIAVNGKKRAAHRVAWELLHGRPIPRGVRLARECAHPACVKHWRLDRPWRMLTDEQVQEIRSSRIPGPAVAQEYGVGTVYVRLIREGHRRGTMYRSQADENMRP
jgi:hypothetical protein